MQSVPVKHDILDGQFKMGDIYFTTTGSRLEVQVPELFGRRGLAALGIPEGDYQRLSPATLLRQSCDALLALPTEEQTKRFIQAETIAQPYPGVFRIAEDLFVEGGCALGTVHPLGQSVPRSEAERFTKLKSFVEALRELSAESLNNSVAYSTAPDTTRVDWISHSKPWYAGANTSCVEFVVEFRKMFRELFCNEGNVSDCPMFHRALGINVFKGRDEKPVIRIHLSDGEDILQNCSTILRAMYAQNILDAREPIGHRESAKARVGNKEFWSFQDLPIVIAQRLPQGQAQVSALKPLAVENRRLVEKAPLARATVYDKGDRCVPIVWDCDLPGVEVSILQHPSSGGTLFLVESKSAPYFQKTLKAEESEPGVYQLRFTCSQAYSKDDNAHRHSDLPGTYHDRPTDDAQRFTIADYFKLDANQLKRCAVLPLIPSDGETPHRFHLFRDEVLIEVMPDDEQGDSIISVHFMPNASPNQLCSAIDTINSISSQLVEEGALIRHDEYDSLSITYAEVESRSQ